MQKKILQFCFFILCYSTHFYSQTWKAEYKNDVRRFDTNTNYTFDCEVLYNAKTSEKLYTAYFGLTNQNTSPINDKSEMIAGYKSKGKSQYQYFSKENSNALIWEEINNNNYVFSDDVPKFVWKNYPDTKTLNGVVLHKATTEFRGRFYTAWYKPGNELAIAPWKFEGLPGLVYEIYDEKQEFSWTLKSINELKENFENPFKDVESDVIVSMKEYPRIRFGALLKKSPFTGTIVTMKQVRNGLEMKFEWEK